MDIFNDIFNNETNKRIMSCNLPSKRLFPSTKTDFDTSFIINEQFPFLESNPTFLNFYLEASKYRLKELNSICVDFSFFGDINIKINSIVKKEFIFPTLLDKFQNISPIITYFDKLLYIFLLEIDNNFNLKKDEKLCNEILNLYKYILNKEIKNGLTINVNSITPTTNLFKIICSQWTIENEHFIPLSKEERCLASDYINQTTKLNQNNEIMLSNAIEVAKNTNNEWITFIDIINKRATQEAVAIKNLMKAKESSKVINNIEKFQKEVKSIFTSKYIIKKESLDVFEIGERINERFQKAPMFCNVYTKDEAPFKLHQSSVYMSINLATFNSVLFSFHKMRIMQNHESFKIFFEDAIYYYKYLINPNEREIPVDINNIVELIKYFTFLISEFYNKNKEQFLKIKLKRIEEPNELYSKSIDYAFTLNSALDSYSNLINSNNTFDNDKILNEIFSCKSKEQLMNEISQYNDTQTYNDNKAITLLFASFHNINYLITEAIKLFLVVSKQLSASEKDDIEKYRSKLLKIDFQITNLIYSELDDNEISLSEYREKKNLDSSSSILSEINEEKYQNELFSKLLKNNIKTLFSNIEEKSTEELIEIKNQLRGQILSFPNCSDKENYIELFDICSEKISNYLIQKQKNNEDYFTIEKNNLLSTLGSNANILPNNCLDSLVTAELLFDKYATAKYNEKGFDYSCISSLYYQALEAAYNTLIWKGYANLIQNTKIDGISLLKLLKKEKPNNIGNKKCIGYLKKQKKDRKPYLDKTYENINESCMYKSFVILLKTLIEGENLDKFSEYIADIIGFKNKEEMFTNDDFMNQYKTFVFELDKSIDWRNNASHGGLIINLEQCTKDKKTVLFDLSKVRETNLGLIQMLLNLLTFNSSHL